jgi:hypothetical protein
MSNDQPVPPATEQPKIDDGGPAYPEQFYFDPGKGMYGKYVSASDVGFGGMTLRDYFAAAALSGLALGNAPTYADLATEAYTIADAMLAARKSGGAA